MQRPGMFKRFALPVLIAGLAAAAAVSPAMSQKTGSVTTSYDSSDENRPSLLAGPTRHEWQRPDRIIRLLAIREGEQVADLGAGRGYFSDVFTGMVGTSGKVYAVEMDPELAEYLETHYATYGNAVAIRGTETDPGLPSHALDLVLTVNTWHRIGNRIPMREAVQRALKPGGRFVVVDWHQGEIAIAPTVDRRLPREELIEEMIADGWTVTTDSRMLKYQYFLIFTPPAP